MEFLTLSVIFSIICASFSSIGKTSNSFGAEYDRFGSLQLNNPDTSRDNFFGQLISPISNSNNTFDSLSLASAKKDKDSMKNQPRLSSIFAPDIHSSSSSSLVQGSFQLNNFSTSSGNTRIHELTQTRSSMDESLEISEAISAPSGKKQKRTRSDSAVAKKPFLQDVSASASNFQPYSRSEIPSKSSLVQGDSQVLPEKNASPSVPYTSQSASPSNSAIMNNSDSDSNTSLDLDSSSRSRTSASLTSSNTSSPKVTSLLQSNVSSASRSLLSSVLVEQDSEVQVSMPTLLSRFFSDCTKSDLVNETLLKEIKSLSESGSCIHLQTAYVMSKCLQQGFLELLERYQSLACYQDSEKLVYDYYLQLLMIYLKQQENSYTKERIWKHILECKFNPTSAETIKFQILSDVIGLPSDLDPEFSKSQRNMLVEELSRMPEIVLPDFKTICSLFIRIIEASEEKENVAAACFNFGRETSEMQMMEKLVWLEPTFEKVLKFKGLEKDQRIFYLYLMQKKVQIAKSLASKEPRQVSETLIQSVPGEYSAT